MVTNSFHEDPKILLGRCCQVQDKSAQVIFYWSILTGKVKNRVFLKLDSRYADYFPEYSSYFESALRLLKYMYGMTNSGKLFADELNHLLFNEEAFKQSQRHMSIYYKYASDVTNIVFYLMLMIVSICRSGVILHLELAHYSLF